MEGFLYAKNFVGGGELHDFPFEGTLPSAVPEPSTWAMMALGFKSGAAARSFRRGVAAGESQLGAGSCLVPLNPVASK
jgi:hypothetical protein